MKKISAQNRRDQRFKTAAAFAIRLVRREQPIQELPPRFLGSHPVLATRYFPLKGCSFKRTSALYRSFLAFTAARTLAT